MHGGVRGNEQTCTKVMELERESTRSEHGNLHFPTSSRYVIQGSCNDDILTVDHKVDLILFVPLPYDICLTEYTFDRLESMR